MEREWLKDALKRLEGERLPVVPVLDPILNMFEKEGIQMFAILGSRLRNQSFKRLAALSLLYEAKEQGALQKDDVVVEATSGRTGNEFAREARNSPFYASNVILVMKKDVPIAKQSAPIIAGATVVNPEFGSMPITTARKIGGGGWGENGWAKRVKNRISYVNLDQYAAPSVKVLYREWAVPQVLEQIDDFQVLVSPIGTGGTLIGLSEGFRNHFGTTNIKIVGAICADGDEIPGMRDLAGMEEIRQPWQEASDQVLKVSRKPAFLCVPWLSWRLNEAAGPSGAATYVAACHYAQQIINSGEINALRSGKTYKVNILFVIHDDVMPYVADRFMNEFSMTNFHPSSAKSPEKLIFGL